MRFLHLFRHFPNIYASHPQDVVPIVPAGDELSLKPQELQWLPLAPAPAGPDAPLVLSQEEIALLAGLPVEKDAIFEFVAPLMPELAYVDEKAGRPCMARATLMVDRRTEFIFATELAHGAKPLAEGARPSLVRGLKLAGMRPRAIHVPKESLAQVLGPACAPIGVPVIVDERLDAAYQALDFLIQRFQR